MSGHHLKEHIFPIFGIIFFTIGIFLFVASIDDKAGPPQKKFMMPSGFNPLVLEDRESPHAKLYMSACTQCHGLPDPKMHTAEEWPAVIVRMMERMHRTQAFSSRSVVVPKNEDVDQIIAYVRKYAAAPDPSTPKIKSLQ
ncbi:MAG: hypothetical protein AAB300_04585 [Nitrospirota bacterium]